MRVLGIETSCDETGVALAENGAVIAATVATQEIHSKWGGVVPELASRLHQRTLAKMVQEMMAQTGLRYSDLDGITVTRGPGLIGALLVGVSFSKGLAVSLNLPWKGVNHLEGHLWAPAAAGLDIPLPALALLVSGGHTELIKINSFGSYQFLGGTVDDAAGEAFDKVGGLLGIAYPAGAELSKLAAKGDPKTYKLPVARLAEPLDFSYSGLKTAALRVIEKLDGKLSEQQKADIAASFQVAAVKQIAERLFTALKQNKFKSLIIAGGVAANCHLRETATSLSSRFSIPLVLPPIEYCTDNGAMIAWLGERYLRERGSDKLTLQADPNLELGGETN